MPSYRIQAPVCFRLHGADPEPPHGPGLTARLGGPLDRSGCPLFRSLPQFLYFEKLQGGRAARLVVNVAQWRQTRVRLSK